MHHFLAICVLLATVTEKLSASTMDTAQSQANDTGNNLMYIVKKKLELFVFGEAEPETATNSGVQSESSAASTSGPFTTTGAPTTSTNTPLLSSTIPPEYTYKSATGSWYKLHDMKQSWNDANSTCASEGAYLTVLNNAQEAEIVSQIVKDAVGEFYGSWIGLRDIHTEGESDWRTIHGEPQSEVYHEWYEGRPYNTTGYYTRKCAVLGASNKQMFDRDCEDYLKWNYVCEISQ